jgi:hypothetical protein
MPQHTDWVRAVSISNDPLTHSRWFISNRAFWGHLPISWACLAQCRSSFGQSYGYDLTIQLRLRLAQTWFANTRPSQTTREHYTSYGAVIVSPESNLRFPVAIVSFSLLAAERYSKLRRASVASFWSLKDHKRKHLDRARYYAPSAHYAWVHTRKPTCTYDPSAKPSINIFHLACRHIPPPVATQDNHNRPYRSCVCMCPVPLIFQQHTALGVASPC